MSGEEWIGAEQDRPTHVCEACWNGVHRNHRPDLGGICIGCSCSVATPEAGDLP